MNIEALKELAAKVEAGQFISRFDGPEHLVWPGMEDMNSLKRHHLRYAYHGSLDAARALHNAVLPGCHVSIFIPGKVTVEDVNGNYHEGEDENVSRAWLLAILRALSQ